MILFLAWAKCLCALVSSLGNGMRLNKSQFSRGLLAQGHHQSPRSADLDGCFGKRCRGREVDRQDLAVGTGALTVKLGLPGWIRSSASTQMPLVNFRDW